MPLSVSLTSGLSESQHVLFSLFAGFAVKLRMELHQWISKAV